MEKQKTAGQLLLPGPVTEQIRTIVLVDASAWPEHGSLSAEAIIGSGKKAEQLLILFIQLRIISKTGLVEKLHSQSKFILKNEDFSTSQAIYF